MNFVHEFSVLYRRFGYFTLALLAFVLSFLLLPTTKMVNNIFYVALALPALFFFLFHWRQYLRLSPFLWLWGGLCAWFLLVGIQSAEFQYFKHLLYVTLFVLLVSLLVSPSIFRGPLFARGLFWVVGGYVFIAAVVYWAIGRYAPGERVLWLPSRMTGPIYTSMWLACCFALALPVWISQRRWIELSIGVCLAVFCMGYVLQSRSGLVGLFAIGVLFLGFLVLHRARLVILILTLIALASVVVFYSIREIPQFYSLFARADAGRFELWHILIEEWLSCGLWLGCGMQHVTTATILGGAPIQHPHNIFLALGLYSGLVSLVVFLIIVAVTLRRAWLQNDPWGLYLFTALIMLNFDGSKLVGNPDELWLLVLLPMALIDNRRGLDSVRFFPVERP